MKKIFLLVLTVFTIGGLTACSSETTDTPTNDVLDVLNTITVSATATDDFTLVVAKDNVVIGWESNNNAIKVTGANAEVTRSTADVNVTLTATGTKGDVTGTKTFAVKVLKNEEPVITTVTTIADALVATDGTSVELSNVSVLKSYSSGTHFTDGTNVIYAYGTKNLTVGDNYDLTAEKASYCDAPQIKDAELTLLTGESTKTIQPVAATVAELNAVTAGGDFKFYSLTATYNKATTALVDGDNSIVISKYSNDASTTALAAFDGLEITVEVFLTGGYNGLELLTYVTTEELESQISDADKVSAAGANIILPQTTYDNLTLPLTGLFDTTITWSSNDEAVIANDGTVVRPNDEDKTITLTAIVTLNETSDDFAFEVLVKMETLVTVIESVTMDFTNLTGAAHATINQNTMIDLLAGSNFSISNVSVLSVSTRPALKIGSSNNPGGFTITNESGATVTSIVINAGYYSSESTAVLLVNDATVGELSSDFADFTIIIGNSNDITISSQTKRVDITSITIYYEV